MALADNALTTVADVKVWTSAYSDAQIEAMINIVSARFERFCQRIFRTGSSTIKMAGSGGRFLFPPRWPISASPAPVITVDGSAVTDFSIESEYSSGDGVNSCLYRESGWPRNVGSAEDLTEDPLSEALDFNISITMTAGYTAVPVDLAFACIKQVIADLSTPSNRALIEERTPGGWQQKYSESVVGNLLLPEVTTTLYNFRSRHYL